MNTSEYLIIISTCFLFLFLVASMFQLVFFFLIHIVMCIFFSLRKVLFVYLTNSNRYVLLDWIYIYLYILSDVCFFFQSVCSEQKVNALTANFVHSPVGENVDWRLSATISPCHVTVISLILEGKGDSKVYINVEMNIFTCTTHLDLGLVSRTNR